MLDKFAEELKEARLKNDISLQQIAQKSRIDLKFIEAIDRGDFSFLPELYVKAFIKQYAKIVGLDETATIKKYEAAKSGKPYQEESVQDKEEKKEDKPTEAKKPEVKVQKKTETKPQQKYFQENSSIGGAKEPDNFFEKIKKDKTLLAVFIIGVLLVLSAIIYFFFIRTSSDIIVSEIPYEQVQQENLQRYSAEKDKESATEPAVTDSLVLSIITTDTSWLKISVDGKKVEEFKLNPKSTKTIKAAKSYSMIVGNSGGTNFKLGEKDLNFTGEKNKVRYISIDKNGLKYLDSEPTFNQN